MKRQRAGGAIAVMALVLAGCASSPAPPVVSPTVRADGRTIITCEPGREAATAMDGELITKEEALRRACEEFGRGKAVTTVEAVIADYGVRNDAPEIKVWMVTYRGLVPSGQSPFPTSCRVGDARLLIDAHTGNLVAQATACTTPPS